MYHFTLVLLSDASQSLFRESALLGLHSGNHTEELLIESILLDSSMNEEKLCSRVFDTNPTITTFFMDITQKEGL